VVGQTPALGHALHAYQRFLVEHEHHNKNPKPFIWTASAHDILAKVTRAKATLAQVGR